MKPALALLFLFASAPCLAGGAHESGADLSVLRDDIATVRRLHDSEGFFTQAQAADVVARKLDRAGQLVGRPVTAAELEGLVTEKRNADRLRSVRDKVVFLAGLFLVIALVGLTLYYFGPVLRSLPYEIYELAAWAACFTALLSQRLWPETSFWLVIPGALAVLPCFWLTKALHFPDLSGREAAARAAATVCVLVWGSFAILYRSEFLGFLAVAALQARLGFSVMAMPLCYFFGFRDKDAVPRSMAASFIMLAAYVAGSATGAGHAILDVFKPGMLKLGAFVYFTGCLIVSNRFYHRAAYDRDVDARYFLLQLLTVLSGSAALYLGALLEVPALSGIGGTFFALYLVEKYMEIPWKKVGWSWGLLGLSLGLYYLAGFATAHPRYFVAW